MHIQRLVTVYEPDVDALPPELRGVLTEQDEVAIRTGPEFFAGLASPDSPDWLRQILAACADSPGELQFYAFDDAPYRPYFRFFWQGEPSLSLPRHRPLRADMPAFLRRLYGVIGAFRENGFETAGGLYPGDELGPLSETGMWVEPGGPIDPTAAIPFLSTFAGSQLCYLPDGGGAWLEAGHLRRVEDAAAEVARYFEALVAGTRV